MALGQKPPTCSSMPTARPPLAGHGSTRIIPAAPGVRSLRRSPRAWHMGPPSVTPWARPRRISPVRSRPVRITPSVMNADRFITSTLSGQATMSDRFSSEAWHRAAPWFEAILRHPFVIELGDGSLPRDVFHRYVIDDAHYLTLYASALVTVAGRWPEPEGAATLARFGAESVEAERVLHRTLLETDVHRAEPTPTCLAYANTLRSWAALGTTGVAMAGLLPCFRIYAEVGTRLAEALSAEQD